LANFRRGSKVVIKERACDECKNNRHHECIMVTSERFMGFDAEEMFNPGHCECFAMDEGRHW
jgi:hypothetical protein